MLYRYLSDSLKPHAVFGGDPPPQTGGESTADMMAALTANLPAFMEVVNQQIGPNEIAQLKSNQATSPALAELQAQIYGTSGREINRIGQAIARENALSSAGTDAAVLAGPGRDLIRQANLAQREIDPEYYRLREQSAAGLGELFKSMSGGEEEAITRFLNRQNLRTGNANSGSMTNVISNAQTFGNAARDRLGQAIQLATGAMPSMRSGVDVFQQATGKPSFANTGDTKFTGVQQGQGQQAAGFANSLLGQIGENQRTSQQLNAQRRDSLDRVTGVIGSLPSVKCCFIFMEGLNGQLPWTVRKYRDLYYYAEPAIATGYKRMAKWLVPVMEKSAMIKSLVNELMIMPMVQYGYYLEGLTDNGSQYKDINNFWLKVWKYLGKHELNKTT